MTDQSTPTDPTRVAPPAAETMEMRQQAQKMEDGRLKIEGKEGEEKLPDTTPPHKLGDVAEWTGKEIALRYADAVNKGALSRDFSDAVALFAPHAIVTDEFEATFEQYLDPARIRIYLEHIPRTARFTPLSGVVIEEKAVVRARFRVDGLFDQPTEAIWTITTDGYDRIVAVRITRALTQETDPHAIPNLPFALPDHLLRQPMTDPATFEIDRDGDVIKS